MPEFRFHFNDFGLKSIAILFFFLLSGCTNKNPPTQELRLLIESSPATMNPRQTLDAIGQRIQLLTFRALTSLDTDLNVVPDLSEKWRYENNGRRFVIQLKMNQVDHLGRVIDADHLLGCIRNYLFTEPHSPHRSSFPRVKSVELKKQELIFNLDGVDPYLAKNLSALRYFATREHPNEPCLDPKPGEEIITNGDYAAGPYPERFEDVLTLRPKTMSAPPLRIEFIRDETSRLLKLLNGEANVVINAFSPTKGLWLINDPKHGFKMIERDGVNTSYLAFNLSDPLLSKKEVRLAIAHAINRESIVKNRLKNQASLASSFLSPKLTEAIPYQPTPYDPRLSEKLLDTVGLPRDKKGIRFSLKYKSTTDRLGLELAQIIQNMLKEVGIHLILDPVEPSVFFAALRSGKFQMASSRWVGVSDGSIYERTLRGSNKNNLAGYNDPETEKLLDLASQEIDPKIRRGYLIKIQKRMLSELPYFPLWHWTNALFIKNTIQDIPVSDISLSGSFISLRNLKFK